MTHTPGAFHSAEAQPFWRIYQHIARPFLKERVASKDHPLAGITEHPLDEHKRLVALINYSPAPLETKVNLAEGWLVGQAWYGAQPVQAEAGWLCTLPANDAVIFTVEKRR